MARLYEIAGRRIFIYGLEGQHNDWLADQLKEMVETSPKSVDGLSLEPKGINDSREMVMEIHGYLTPSQLRLLANAIENIPTNEAGVISQ